MRTPAGTMAPQMRRLIRLVLVNLLIALIIVVEIYPLFWILTNSFKSQFEFLNSPLLSLPTQLLFDNYVQAWTTGDLGRNALNSLIVTLPSLFLIIVLGAAAGFALEVMIFRGRNAVLLFIVGGLMVPLQIILLPLFTGYSRLGLSGTYWPLILTYVGHGLPLSVYLFATYFRAVPRELFEAVALDGGGPYRAFFSVGLPIARNGILTVALLMFFSIWNDLLIALSFTIREEMSTIQVGLLRFNDEFGSTDYGPLFAAISMTVFSTLAVYIGINQQVMKGMTAGSTKG
jgi:raffinose/stachyose/melibiose transport system permease protein